MAIKSVSLELIQVFNPTDGRPVFEASIYVGNPNTDPSIEANRKQLQTRDATGTLVNISQPVRTNPAGIPVSEGNQIQLIVDDPYSIRIDDAQGNQIFYSAQNTI